jgi:hypothetical protein
MLNKVLSSKVRIRCNSMNIYIAGSLFSSLCWVECRSKHRRFYCLLLFSIVSFLQFRFSTKLLLIQANAPSNLVFWSQSQYIDNEIFRWCLLLYYFFFISIVYINLVIYCLSMAINISVPQWVKGLTNELFFNGIKFDKKVRLLRKNSILLLAHVFMQHTLFI